MFYHSWKILTVILSFISSFSYMYMAAFLSWMDDYEANIFYQLDNAF